MKKIYSVYMLFLTAVVLLINPVFIAAQAKFLWGIGTCPFWYKGANCYIAVDSKGDIYLTGTVNPSGANQNVFTAKYNREHQLQWTNMINNPENDYGRSIAIDSADNVILAGERAINGSDISVYKLSGANGQVLWSQLVDTRTSFKAGYDVAVNPADNSIYACGGATEGFSDDYFAVRLSSMGIPGWTNSYNGPATSNDYIRAIGVDHNGNIIISGYAGMLNGRTVINTIKMNSAGKSLWTNTFFTNASSSPRDLAVDNNNDIIVVGNYNGLTPDIVVMKYNPGGTLLWSHIYDFKGFQDNAGGVAVDNENNVYLSGYVEQSSGVEDFIVLKYNSNGDVQWTNIYNSGNDKDKASGLAIDQNTVPNRLYISGYIITSVGSNQFYLYALELPYTPAPGTADDTKTPSVDLYPNYLQPGDVNEIRIFLKAIDTPAKEYHVQIISTAGNVVKDLGMVDYNKLKQGFDYTLKNESNDTLSTGTYLILVSDNKNRFIKKFYIKR